MIYKRQNFCYRLVQFRRYRLSHIHVCIQHSGKWFAPSGTTPQSANADSCLRKILRNRTVPRTVRPFQGSHESYRI